jgi:hypothetical protein
VPAAIDAYSGAGRIALAASADAARQAMVEDWWAAVEQGQRAVMYALRRGDVADLNRRARARADAAGRLGHPRIAVADVEFAPGDAVLCLRNDHRLGVRNGTAAVIAAVHPDTGTIDLDDGTALSAEYINAGHLGYSYATTIHKAQGATVDRAFLLGSETLYREAGYVGLSRARQRSDLYLVSTQAELRRGPIDRLAHQLTTSKAHTLGLDQLTKPADGDVQAHRWALVADPPPWAVAALGLPPLAGRDRGRWADSAAHLAAYRDANHITDPADALGPEPPDGDQRRAWQRARLVLGRHHVRSVDLDHGLEL